MSTNGGKAKQNGTIVDNNGGNGGEEQLQGGTGKEKKTRGGNGSDGSDSGGSDIEELIVAEDMQGMFVEIVSVNSEMFQTVLPNTPWESMHTMINHIRGIDNVHMSCTLNTFRQLWNDQRFGPITVTLHSEAVLEDGDCGS